MLKKAKQNRLDKDAEKPTEQVVAVATEITAVETGEETSLSQVGGETDTYRGLHRHQHQHQHQHQ